MDFSVPAYAGDAVVDADGAVTEDLGVPMVQAGAPLYNILPSARLAYGIGGQSDPKSIWIDRDGSKRYTPNFSADSVVAQPVVLGLPLPDGDVGAPIKSGGMGNLKILVSNPAELNTWHPGEDALFKDSGTITNLVDDGDTRVGAAGRFKQQSVLVPGKASITVRGTNNTCPVGIAPEDFIHIVGKANIAVKEIIYDREPTSGACIAQVVLYTASYSYAIDDQFELVTPYIGELDITDLKDNTDNGAPDAQTTNIKVLTGTLKGIAVGDTIRIVRGASSIDFLVTELSSIAKVIKVSYVGGGLGLPGDNYLVAVSNQKTYSGILTGLLYTLPNWITYADEDADNIWDASEPLYSDEDATGTVSKDDKRITGVVAEKRLLKKQGAVDSLGGTYVDSATMAAPKWFSQTKPWSEGEDIVIDHDGDGFYNLDLMTLAQVKNEGTAASTDITRVALWLEDNGAAGFQGTFSGQQSDLLIGLMPYNAVNSQWKIQNLNQPLITQERFYVTVDVGAGATDQSTLRFAITKDGIVTNHRKIPDAVSPNSNTQTVSAAAVLPPEQQAAQAGISAQNSIVRVVDTLTAPADGASVATVEVEVRDTNNARMENQIVRLERLRAAEDTVLATEQKTTNVNGIASFPQTSQEAGVFRFRARVGSLMIGNVSLTFTAVGGAEEPPAPGAGGLVEGDLFMSASAGRGGTVYYYANGKRYPFPNERVYLTWYPNFESVTIKKIAAVDVGTIPWGTNVRYRPGTRMLKVPDDPKVYAVTPGGKVCWVKDEDIAKKFYGTTWNKKIDDLLASLFVSTYDNDPACDLTLDSKYPTGTLVSVNDKSYYIDNGSARIISGDALSGNRFREEFLIAIANLNGYALGAAVGNAEFSRVVN